MNSVERLIVAERECQERMIPAFESKTPYTISARFTRTGSLEIQGSSYEIRILCGYDQACGFRDWLIEALREEQG